MNEPILALDAGTVSRIVGVSRSLLADWQRRGVFTSTYVNLTSESPSRRVYSFRDIVNIRALSQIRQQLGLPLAEVKRAGEYLAQHDTLPWSKLGIGIIDRKLIFRDPETNEWRDASSQDVLELNLAEIPAEVERLVRENLRRDPADSGRIERNRNILHNAPVLAGTRIPTSTIWVYHEDGYTAAEILEQYPQLTPDDIKAAIEFESRIRRAA
jgi:uncharacterized protein (DUF433 family)